MDNAIKRHLQIVATLAAVFFAFTLALHSEIIDRIAAVVDGTIITTSDLQKESILVTAFGDMPRENDALLQGVIERTLVEEQIAQFPDVEVTDADIDAALSGVKAPSDLPPNELRDAVRRRILRARFFELRFRQFITASDDEVQKYYAEVFVPEARSRGLNPIPSATEANDSIRANIIDEKLSREVQDWLESIRRRSNVEIFK